MSTSLRPFADSDFEKLHSLDRACYRPGIAYSKSMLRWYLRLRGGLCIIAEVEGQIQGFILAETEPPEGHIITLDVAEPFRRTGIGTALTEAAEKMMAGRGVSLVGLETATDNEAGVAFWKMRGYRTVGVIPRYYLDRVDAWFMRKVIAATKET
ncbi:MAG TPA: N-acetyltransferase [Candidatus Acidoferrales bacterium]|nr:N-acetyltransferase [Candidatus Acidoferrales bacterium]